HDPLPQRSQEPVAGLPALLLRGLDRLAGWVGGAQGVLRPEPRIARHAAGVGVLEPLADHVQEVRVLVAPGQPSHDPGEIELSLELPHEPAERGLGRPRPGTCGIGVEADLDSHHSGRSLAAATRGGGENTADGPIKALERLSSTVLSGRYRLESKLGSGGVSAVYLPVDEGSDRPVALKVLHPRD